MKKLDEICDSKFVPSDDDILHVKQEKHAIATLNFELRHIKHKLIDISGQKNEVRKWIHMFEDVDSVLITVSLAE